MTWRAATLALIVLTTTSVAEDVRVRSSGEVVSGSIVHADAQILTIETRVSEDADPETRRIAWTDVQAVTPPFDPAGEQAAAMRSGEGVWRAHERLQRRDIAGAARLLLPHRDALLGFEGPVSKSCAEGLLACAVWAGDWPGAITAWLGLIASGDPTTRHAWVGLDPETQMVMVLPPAFAGAPSARAFESAAGVLQDRLPPESRAGVLLRIYMDAAALQGINEDARNKIAERYDGIRAAVIRSLGRDDGVLLAADVVGASAGLPENRAAARSRLRVLRERRPEGWIDGWAGIAIARSHVVEPGDDDRRLGVVESIDTALRLEEDAPGLAALAWHDAARGARLIGDDAAARTLESELNTRSPDHPAARALAETLPVLEGLAP